MPVHKGPDCVGEEMSRFHKGEMHSGKGGKVVTSPKQAKAIALSACGESKYSETLQSMGFPAETSEEVVAMFAESFVKKAKSSMSSASFEEPDWQKEFETGKSASPENPENYHTGIKKGKGRGQLRIGKGPGDMGKQPVDGDSEMMSPVAFPKQKANWDNPPSKQLNGMQMLG